MTQEQKLLQAAKFTLASLRLNKIHLPTSEAILERAIAGYGKNHLDDVNANVADQGREVQSAISHTQVLFDSLKTA